MIDDRTSRQFSQDMEFTRGGSPTFYSGIDDFQDSGQEFVVNSEHFVVNSMHFLYESMGGRVAFRATPFDLKIHKSKGARVPIIRV